MVELTVDGNQVEVPEGSMVMHAAQKVGLYAVSYTHLTLPTIYSV